MILNAANIFSTLGNPNSLVPLAVKDLSATAGMTAGSFVTGKEEGADRFIDEIGTEVIWLFGIPAFKWLYNNTIYKAANLDSNFDARNLKNKEIFEKIKEYAPNEDIKKEIEKIGGKSKLFKNITTGKFFVATGLTVAAYLGLTKAKQKYTAKKIRANLIKEYQESQKQEESKKAKNQQDLKQANPAFKGAGSVIESLAFSPVKNMYVLDGFITATRLGESRTPQEFIGYSIKEAMTLCFMYYAGGKIQELLEKRAVKKFNKNIGLDARVLEDPAFKRAFEDGTIEKGLKEFEQIKSAKDAGNLKKDAVSMYEFIHKNPENSVVKAAKKSDIIKMFKKTDKIDTRKYIDLKEFEGVYDNMSGLYKQYKEALKKGETSEKFFAGLKRLKRDSILTNIGACVLALGVITPALMLLKRFTGKKDTEFETKRQIREQLIKEGVIA